MNRAERLRLNPYQRGETVGRGKEHWSMAMAGRKKGWVNYVHTLFKKGAKHPVLGQYYTKAVLDKALMPPIGSNKVTAFVNHNRWVATCECGGAEVVDPGDPVFYCFSCFNDETKGRTRKVTFPTDRSDIENVLEVRKNPYNRNWLVHETLKDLEDENTQHGLPKSKSEDSQ